MKNGRRPTLPTDIHASASATASLSPISHHNLPSLGSSTFGSLEESAGSDSYRQFTPKSSGNTKNTKNIPPSSYPIQFERPPQISSTTTANTNTITKNKNNKMISLSSIKDTTTTTKVGAPSSSLDTKNDIHKKLSKYTRGSDRRQVLRTLKDVTLLPRMHEMKSVWVEDIAAAEREAAVERASLNGVKFLQVKSVDESRNEIQSTPIDSYFLQTLREICGHMCDMDGVDADPMALYGGLLLRLSRSVSEHDALEIVTQWTCGKGELVILPLKRRHHDNSVQKCAPPIDLELFVEAGNVHAKVTMRNELGLYKRSDLEQQCGLSTELSPWSPLILAQHNISMQASSMKQLSSIQYQVLDSSNLSADKQLKPWVFVDADVVERINFGSGSSVRMLHLSLPEDKNGGYVVKK